MDHLFIHLARHLPGAAAGFFLGLVIVLAIETNTLIEVLIVGIGAGVGIYIQDEFFPSRSD